MPISFRSAATTACEDSGWELTNLSLHKLLYLAHMRHLGTAGEPLIRGNFEAWKYGPVISPLYHLVKKFGKRPIDFDIFEVDRNLQRPEHNTINYVMRKFGKLSPGQLVELTHQAGGAWDLYYDPDFENWVIPDDAILAEYQADPF